MEKVVENNGFPNLGFLSIGAESWPLRCRLNCSESVLIVHSGYGIQQVLDIEFNKFTPSFYDGLYQSIPFTTVSMFPPLEFENFFMHASTINTWFAFLGIFRFRFRARGQYIDFDIWPLWI